MRGRGLKEEKLRNCTISFSGVQFKWDIDYRVLSKISYSRNKNYLTYTITALR